MSHDPFFSTLNFASSNYLKKEYSPQGKKNFGKQHQNQCFLHFLCFFYVSDIKEFFIHMYKRRKEKANFSQQKADFCLWEISQSWTGKKRVPSTKDSVATSKGV